MNVKQAKAFVRKMRISPNTILLVQEGTAIADRLTIDNLGKAIEAMKINGVMIMVVKDPEKDIKALDKSVMNKHGWFRMEDMSSLLRTVIHEKPQQPPV